MKKIIFVAVGAVSLIGGIAAGLIHRSNKRYRRALEELEYACEVLEGTTDVLDNVIYYLESDDSFFDDFDDDDEECSGCEADEKCCEYAERILKELEEGTYRE
ncbi:MAG: hypothetical protein J6U50_04165 [Lachnospiraceae bacterium]|nr:hypothetical protein [Lachnospiraceae bacterium]